MYEVSVKQSKHSYIWYLQLAMVGSYQQLHVSAIIGRKWVCAPPCLGAHTHLQLDYACQESRPTHNNAPAYCESTSSPDSELHASRITHSIITSHNQICKIDEC